MTGSLQEMETEDPVPPAAGPQVLPTFLHSVAYPGATRVPALPPLKGPAGRSAQPFRWETQIPSFCLISSPKMSVNFPPGWESPHLYFYFPA